MSSCPFKNNSFYSDYRLAINIDTCALFLLAYLDSKFCLFVSELQEYGLKPVYFKHPNTVKINHGSFSSVAPFERIGKLDHYSI